jgi:hypothetical protein
LLASAADSLATVVRTLGWIVAAIIAVGVLLVVLKANPQNGIVSTIHDIAHALAGPFTGMFQLHDHRVGVAVNWGIAALVYVLAAALVARLITLVGNLALRRSRRAASD